MKDRDGYQITYIDITPGANLGYANLTGAVGVQ